MAEIFGVFSRAASASLEQKLGRLGLGLPRDRAAIDQHGQIYQDATVFLRGPGAAIKRNAGEQPPFVQIAAATIYNRTELMSQLGLSASSLLSDTDLLAAAY